MFLDRDGVINRKLPEGRYVTRWDEFELLPGAADAIAHLNRSGRTVIVLTNQRGVALGRMTEEDLNDIHARLRVELARFGASLDAIFYCPHDRHQCDCRKPKTGMIDAAFRQFPDARPANSVFIGDSLSDMECGHNAGIATIFVVGEAENRKPGMEVAREIADAVVSSLSEAVLLLD